MEYFITFLEGLITFISPCLLPMLPIYLTYLAGSDEEHQKSATLKNALGFILGFSIMFLIMGAFAGSIGMLLTRHQTIINIVCGLIIILFGLSYLGVFHLPVFRHTKDHSALATNMNFFSSITFGIVFSIGMDSMCRCFFRFRSHACFPTRFCRKRNSAFCLLFPRTWHSFLFECCFNSPVKICFCLDKKSLHHHQCRLRRFIDCSRDCHDDWFT